MTGGFGVRLVSGAAMLLSLAVGAAAKAEPDFAKQVTPALFDCGQPTVVPVGTSVLQAYVRPPGGIGLTGVDGYTIQFVTDSGPPTKVLSWQVTAQPGPPAPLVRVVLARYLVPSDIGIQLVAQAYYYGPAGGAASDMDGFGLSGALQLFDLTFCIADFAAPPGDCSDVQKQQLSGLGDVAVLANGAVGETGNSQQACTTTESFGCRPGQGDEMGPCEQRSLSFTPYRVWTWGNSGTCRGPSTIGGTVLCRR